MTEGNGQAIHPIESQGQAAGALTIAHHHKAADGSEYLREGAGYTKIVDAWAAAEHIPPIRTTEKLGDVLGWVQYVGAYGTPNVAYLTWTDARLRAVFDYHTRTGEPGRATWIAEHPFLRTRQWDAWMALTSRGALSQKALIEALEDHREDVRTPDAATLVGLLRVLRGTVNASAQASLDPNGGTKLEYARQTQVSVTLPETITIGIPVLKGHTVPDEQGIAGPVRYELDVRIRVDVLDEGKIAFRLSMPNADQALEDAVADRVRTAQALLDEADVGYELLRAAN